MGLFVWRLIFAGERSLFYLVPRAESPCVRAAQKVRRSSFLAALLTSIMVNIAQVGTFSTATLKRQKKPLGN
jgi:hypothetical protein